MSEREVVVAVCHRLAQGGLVSGRDGNVSLRASQDSMYVTPSGVNKGRLVPGQVLLQGFDGQVREGSLGSTKEAGLHIRIYGERPDIRAIIHTHPPFATAFACRGQVLPTHVLTEVAAIIGPMALAPYAPPGTMALVDSLDGLLGGHNVIFLQNHGIIVMGSDMETAYDLMDALENAAKTIAIAQLLGGVVPIPQG